MLKKIFSFLTCLMCVLYSGILMVGHTDAQKQFEVREEGGVKIVSNPRQPVPKNGLKKRMVFTEDLSIGQKEGDENYMFGDIISLNTDDSGNFYVSDESNLRVLKYDEDGQYLLTIGRKGQGPGEFQSLPMVRFDKDNNLYVGDVTSRRISFFDREGKYLRQLDMPGSFENIYITGGGAILACKNEQKFISKALQVVTVLGLFDQDFKLTRELLRVERKIGLPGSDESSRIQIMANMINLMVFQPYQLMTLAGNGSIYIGYPEDYEIKMYSPQGKLLKIITRDFKPVPVSKKDKARVEDELDNVEMAREASEELRKKILKHIKYPKYKPAYQSFSLVGSGMNQSFSLLENGWLLLIADYIKDEYTLFDLFDGEGRYIAQFKAAIPVEGLFFKNGKAYAIATDEGYKFVKRYNISIQELRGNNWIDCDVSLK